MTIDIPALRAMLEKATPRPWARDITSAGEVRIHRDKTGIALFREPWAGGADADMCIAAVNALGPLLDRIEELENAHRTR